ncbi:hypothetical protein [Mucilaginibacter sp. HD30]
MEQYKFTIEDFFVRNSIGYNKLFVITQDAESIELSTFLHEYPITFYFKDFASLRLNEISEKSIRNGSSFNIQKVNVLDWSDTDIECEFSGNSAGKIHIHRKIENFLIGRNPDVLIYDHGSGEMADFVFIKDGTYSLEIELYHCKGSGGKLTGNRVDDVYEVCGQSIKSGVWTNSAILKDKIEKRLSRTNPSTFIIGDNILLNKIFALNKMIQFKIVAVQPGLLKENIAPNISEILAATDSYIENGDSIKFNLITS